MRRMSFFMTTEQMRAKTKTVTRRGGWLGLKPGDRVLACVKCMGLKRGEKVEVIGLIEIVSNRREPIDLLLDPSYGPDEMTKEGFPGQPPAELVARLRERYADEEISRIEFKHI